MDVSSKILSQDKGLLHQLTIKNLPTKFLRFRKRHDVIKIKKNYDNNQKMVAKIRLDKSIVANREQIIHDDAEIKFDKDVMDIVISHHSINQIIKKGLLSYYAQYQIMIPQKINIHIKIKLQSSFYETSILPRLERLTRQKENDERNHYKRKPLTPEEYRKKDMYEADRDAYRYSPNSDGGRSRREILSGNFSGESRYRK